MTVDGKPKRELDVADDHDGHPTVWALGSPTFRVIQRQDRSALRVKDSAHPARTAFKGLTFYSPNPEWRRRARFEPAPAKKTIRIVNVLNQVEDMPSPATLRFDVDGRLYGLDPVVDRDHEGLFVLFKNATSGHGSYPPGRFLYTDLPASDGSVELDFNRAFSPPCAFTSFATCPLAPSQNHLPLKIEAGERLDGERGGRALGRRALSDAPRRAASFAFRGRRRSPASASTSRRRSRASPNDRARPNVHRRSPRGSPVTGLIASSPRSRGWPRPVSSTTRPGAR